MAKTAPSWFELAQINPSAYQGSARDNEALRAVIDPKARTFYNAYVNKFHTWDAHPSQRIEKLSQPSAVAA
ncbi:hypothetical protein ACI4CU_27555, partial [Klebsiella pneumoniae]|uniref:hypothetical protein n=1 Tax=Klebsiella pneumoniae TaxID=573 RepID=UPI0038531CB6